MWRSFVRKQSRTVPYLLVCRMYTSRATVPYRTVHQLTCRVDNDGGAALGMRTVLYCTTCRYGSPHFRTECVRDSFGIRSRFVRDACLPACLPAGRTVLLYCTTCRYGSPHCQTGCVQYSFNIRLGFVWDSFGMPAFLPASLHACRQAVDTRTSTVLHTTSIRTSVVPGPKGIGRTVLYCTTCRYGSPHCRTGCVRDSFGIRSRFVRDACLPACLPAGRTVLYCTTCRYGSPHCRTGCVRYSFEIRLGFVRDACLPATLPSCLPYQYGTSYHDYIFVLVHQSYQGYGTVGAAMRPRCGDPPNKVCTAVGKLDR